VRCLDQMSERWAYFLPPPGFQSAVRIDPYPLGGVLPLKMVDNSTSLSKPISDWIFVMRQSSQVFSSPIRLDPSSSAGAFTYLPAI
jgi:hypothetical protein